jgi:hypothetical protein
MTPAATGLDAGHPWRANSVVTSVSCSSFFASGPT